MFSRSKESLFRILGGMFKTSNHIFRYLENTYRLGSFSSNLSDIGSTYVYCITYGAKLGAELLSEGRVHFILLRYTISSGDGRVGRGSCMTDGVHWESEGRIGLQVQ